MNKVITGNYVEINDGIEASFISFELDGETTQNETPSPDEPSELISVGYKNLFDEEDWYNTLHNRYKNDITKETVDGIEYYKFHPSQVASIQYKPIDFKENTQYTITYKARQHPNTTHNTSGFVFYYTDGTHSDWTNGRILNTQEEHEYFLTSDAGKTVSHFRLSFYHNEYALARDIQLTEGTEYHKYVPYDKYGVEVKTTKKNLFDSYLLQIFTKNIRYITVHLKPGTTYTMSSNLPSSTVNPENANLFILNSTDTPDSLTNGVYPNEPRSVTTLSDGVVIIAYRDENYDYDDEKNQYWYQLEEGSEATEYEPYSGKTYTYTLDQPLRSIGNTKDLLYIKSGRLYVDRKIGSVVLDGSENWHKSEERHYYQLVMENVSKLNNSSQMGTILSNSFVPTSPDIMWNNNITAITNLDNLNGIRIRFKDNPYTIETFKTWLSTNTIEVQYILVESYIEELGKVEIPSTYKGITNVGTNDILQPNMRIIYGSGFSSEDKEALRNSTASIRTKLIVKATDELPEVVLTDDNSIKSFDYDDDRLVPDKGFIGHFVARTLNGELDNISDDFDIDGRELEYHLGIYRMNDRITTWYNYGTFIVVNPSDDDVRDNTKFEAMDYTKKFNIDFDGDYTDEEFDESYNDLIGFNTPEGEVPTITPVTASWLARYTCKQAGVELATYYFRNSDFLISQNPFQAGESCRDVMKAIGKLALSWVRVGTDDRCYIDFDIKDKTNVDEQDIIDNNQYYSLEKQSMFGPLNKIVIGMENVDGESYVVADQESIEANGEHALYVYDNPLTNTFELRQQAASVAKELFGLTYMQLDCETVGHPWWIGTEMIDIKDMHNNDAYLYPFNKALKYTGHIRTSVNSIGKTEIDETLGYNSDVLKNIRKASLNVDKQNAIITAITESVQSLSNKENNDYQDILNTFNEYMPRTDFTDLTNRVEQIQTDTYTKTEIQQIARGVSVDGTVVQAVISETGKFDIDGLLIEKTDAKTKGRFNEKGMKITDATGSVDSELLFAGYDEELNETIVRTKNINVEKYLTVGKYSRIEDFVDDDGNEGTGVFFVGGDY